MGTDRGLLASTVITLIRLKLRTNTKDMRVFRNTINKYAEYVRRIRNYRRYIYFSARSSNFSDRIFQTNTRIGGMI